MNKSPTVIVYKYGNSKQQAKAIVPITVKTDTCCQKNPFTRYAILLNKKGKHNQDEKKNKFEL
jgi:hypothetical protein